MAYRLYTLIPPKWMADAKSIQYYGVEEGALAYNAEGYNTYFYPNYPSQEPVGFAKASDIDVWEWVFVDMDLKEGKWASKYEFGEAALALSPTRIVDSGNGIHVYWRVTDLDAMSFLRLSRRLARLLDTDLAVVKLKQLMRLPGSVNTKDANNPKLCEEIYTADISYTCEDLDRLLPPLSPEDNQYCETHYNRAYQINQAAEVDDTIPLKFHQLIKNSPEAKRIWSGDVDDRSVSDYRLGHLMLANEFTKEEAMSVLVNTGKALERGPTHRVAYAQGIVDKVYAMAEAPDPEDASQEPLSRSVRDILQRGGDTLKGTRFPCHSYLDATECGFRLSHVIGLVAGSGVGKTSVALNMFMGFVKNNPDYVHFFIPLEQKVEEIADRWKSLCGDNTYLYDKVELISNYGQDGSFRHLSLDDIEEYILKYQEETGKKVGCVVIDHIGALRMEGKDGENQRIVDICHKMKSFAIKTNTLLVMQSQAPREKAGIGDLELNKDAAYGSVYFESYCDFLITMWQPLKRCYVQGAPLVTAYKFCKIRHKKENKDKIHEDVPYKILYEPDTESFRELTQDEETSFKFFLNQATNKRKEDRKTAMVEYATITWTGAKDESDTSPKEEQAPPKTNPKTSGKPRLRLAES